MSDEEDHSSNSSSSYDSSASSSPDGKRISTSRSAKNFDDFSGSESDVDVKASADLKEDKKETLESGDEDSSGSSDDEDNEDPGNKSPSSSSESSDHEDDDDKENSQKEDEDGDDDARSIGSRSPDSANGSHSKSDDSDSAHGSVTDIKKLWERDPDFYGIRRSSRAKPPTRPPKLYPQVIKKTGSRKYAKTVKKRRSLSDDESSDEEVTRSTRKRTNNVSYKEQESEDEDDKMSVHDEVEDMEINGEDEEQVDTIEKIMDIRLGKVGATGSATTLYVINERGDPNETLSDGEATEKETQFLIKWVGLSHLHNTWESLETLQEKKAKGLKKLDNYCKREDDLKRWKSNANPEDIEYYECQLELQQELAKSYTRAERIIAEHINDEGETEYYVKWDCLSYSEATWEKGSLISNRNPEVIKIYKKREASNRTPASSAKVLKYRPKFSPLKEQPEFMTGDTKDLILRDYQLDGLNWLVHSWCKENSVILADEMGLGKTIQTICFLSYLFEFQNLYGPYLLVVPLSTMTAWQKEFGQWAPQINVVTYLGDVASRDIIREYEWYFKPSNKLKFNAILTTYEIVLKDKAFLSEINWAVLMVDEAHRLKNGDSLLYKTLQEFNTNHRLLITGTPLQNSLKELWSLLHFIMPHKFDEWETFESEHDDAATKGYSKLHRQLEPFILRRVKKDVEKSLPAKVEQILRVEMTSLQKQYYKWILTKNYNALRKGVKGSVSSFINVVMELKKCCNHAMLVKPMEGESNDSLTHLIKGSGKLMLLDKLLVRLKETGHRVLIFSQMVRMLDIIAEYLQQRRFSFQRLDGSIKGDIRKQALDHFNAEGSQDFCFLLSTRAGGLGINLATADTVIIFDSDWNPQNDLQAQARAHRIGQKNQVNIYRLVTKNSVEEDIVERAKQKMVLDHLVIQRMDTTGRTVLDKGSKTGQPFNKDELNAILKFGAEELFKEDDNEGDDQCDIDEILRRAETHEDAGERPGDELLSAFKVASFSVNEDEEVAPVPQKDWDKIIPEDVRSKIEAEEKEKEMAGLYLPPRSSRAANAAENGNTANNNDALRKIKAKRRKMMRDNESEEESDSDDDRPRKRGRPNKSAKEGSKGFTDNQIRKFIKSFKRFPRPLSRIDLIAKDCGLTDKSIPELRKLGEQLIQGCQAAMTDLKNPLAGPVHIKEEAPESGANADGKKKREKGPLFKVAGINVNARTLSIALEELKPLGTIMPKEPEARKSWKFDLKAKVPPYDVEWGPEEDTKLLIGVWEYGTGAWDIIRDSDPLLKEKIFPETEKEKKPQLKHAQSRAEYLLKVMKKHLALTQAVHPRKKREKKEKGSKPIPALADSENKRDKEDPGIKQAKGKKRKPKDDSHAIPDNDDLPGINAKTFGQCKEMMRPVKNALKSLDNPDASLSEKDQVKHTKNCLIEIGDQIQKCLEKFTNEKEHKDWKSNLWIFVSHFTEYDANKLYKLYRRASKKADERERLIDKKPEKPKESTKHHHYHRDKKDRHREKDRNSVRNFQENSNSSSSLAGNSARNSQSKLSTYERDKKRERFAQKMGELPPEPRVPQHPPIDDPNYSSSSPRKFHHGYPNNGPNYRGSTASSGNDYYNSYRGNSNPGERSRERAPGDPRQDRSGGHASKSYRNERDGYERDRNVPPGERERRPYSTPPQRSRWGPGPEGFAGGPRRGGHSSYYGPNAVSPVVPPSHFNSSPSPVPFHGAGPVPHHSGRIAPPLGTDWRRVDGADADLGINQRHIDEDSHSDPMESGIDLGRRRRELY